MLPRGTVPVEQALAMVNELEVFSSGSARAATLGSLGLLRAMQGASTRRGPWWRRTGSCSPIWGCGRSVAAHSIAVAEVEIMAGDYHAAERDPPAPATSP